MSLSLQRLLALFARERALGRALVLATVVRTSGSTYTKAGEHMLMTDEGEYAGLLSGGCLEGDLAMRARAVLQSGQAALAHYDTRGPDDLLFGLGSGCEGEMDILLQRLDAASDWQPLQGLAEAWRAQRPESLLLVVRSSDPAFVPGSGVFGDASQSFGFGNGAVGGPHEGAQALLHRLARQRARGGASRLWAQAAPGVDLLVLQQSAPTRIVLLGAGPDAQPVAHLAGMIGWHLTVIDHRSHYAQAARFPEAAAVLSGGPQALAALLSAPPAFAAAVVMSHHLATDSAYLRILADTDIPYVGLLGPASRRERLIAELGEAAQRLRPRLRAPVGLVIGASTPEAIALSIVAEIQGALPVSK
jgi:xanthine/CO dehydrogenase XdhC/CoxF family maturation factor